MPPEEVRSLSLPCSVRRICPYFSKVTHPCSRSFPVIFEADDGRTWSRGRDFINADGGLAFGNTGFVVSVGHRRHAENHFQIISMVPSSGLFAGGDAHSGSEFLFLEVRIVPLLCCSSSPTPFFPLLFPILTFWDNSFRLCIS